MRRGEESRGIDEVEQQNHVVVWAALHDPENYGDEEKDEDEEEVFLVD